MRGNVPLITSKNKKFGGVKMGFFKNLKGGLSYNIDPLKKIAFSVYCGKLFKTFINIKFSLCKTLCKSCVNVYKIGGIFAEKGVNCP